MHFIKVGAIASFALVTLAGMQPAFAKDQCNKEGAWRQGDSASGTGIQSQVFRIEARNRSGTDGVFAKVEGDDTQYELEKGFTRISREKYTQEELEDGNGEKVLKTVKFYTSAKQEFAICTFTYEAKYGSKGAKFPQIRYLGGSCNSTSGPKISCDREYAPEKHRMKVSLTVKDK